MGGGGSRLGKLLRLLPDSKTGDVIMMRQAEGIVAVATAPGRSGIGVIRFSGAESASLGLIKGMTGISSPQPRHAYFTSVLDTAGKVLDKGIVIWFKAPHSYTGEDVVEFQVHGNPVLLNLIIKNILAFDNSVRLAEPGEFTKRAFLNGRLDLAQAEAVMDFVNASSESALRAANRSLSGGFSKECEQIEEELIELRTQVEAILDFPEEEIDALQEGKINEKIGGISAHLQTVIRTADQGQLLQEGAVVVLVGSPNVGKSSLLNRLSEKDVAIVTEVPGTTRDLLGNAILINGVRVQLVDTAGLRQTDDVVESAGISRTLKQIEKADMVLHLEACNVSQSPSTLELIHEHLPEGTPVLHVVNKIDLLEEPFKSSADRIGISAKFGTGIEDLKRAILKIVGFDGTVQSVYMARRRHLEELRKAQNHVSQAKDILNSSARQLDLVAEELRLAGTAMGRILGEFSPDDLLGKIFSTFCIGK